MHAYITHKQSPGGLLQNFSKFKEKCLFRSLFLNKVAGQPATMLKNRLPYFLVNIAKFLRKPFLSNNSARLPLNIHIWFMPLSTHIQKQLFRNVLRKRCFNNMQQIYRTPMSKCDFNKGVLQFYWSRSSEWVFSCKFAAYFPNTFPLEHMWRAASVSSYSYTSM